MRTLRTYWITVAISIVVVGCTSAPAPVITPQSDDPLEYFLELATLEGDANSEQLQILSDAVDRGTLEFEPYAEAVGATIACMSDAGVLVQGPEVDRSDGYPVLRYQYAAGVTADGLPDNPIPDQCMRANSFYVELAYTSQSSSRDAQDQLLESKRGEVSACATEAGILVDDDLPIREWLQEVFAAGEAGRDCIVFAGITGF